MPVKHKTIKSVPEHILEAFTEYKNDGAFQNDTAAFVELVKSIKNKENPAAIAELQSKLDSLQAQNQDLLDDYGKEINANKQLDADNTELKQRLTTLTENPPVKEVEIEKPLGPNQFIVDPDTDTVTKWRMVRKQLRANETFTGSDTEFPNFFVMHCANYYIKNKFEDIFNRKP